MKTIKNHLNSFLTSICYALLSLLGFNSCSSEQGGEVMYGMPTGDFEVKGTVTDEEGKPVEDAEIRVTRPDLPSGMYSLGTTKTNPEGKYNVKALEMFGEAKVVCLPSQYDLEPDSVIIELNFDLNGNGAWDLGHAEETVNFTLKSKEE